MDKRSMGIGERFGRLTSIRFARKDKRGQYIYLFKCDCGNEKEIVCDAVKRGRTVSCGCFKREVNRLQMETHGHTSNGKQTPEHKAWVDMIQRCTNPKCKSYNNYGGRGVKVCFEWLISFETFLNDMGLKPGPDYSIDRKDNDGNYEKSNCKWATRIEQNNNQRPKYGRRTKMKLIKINMKNGNI